VDSQLGNQKFTNKIEFVALILIVLVSAFFNLYDLDELPPGLHHDEAFHGVDAMSILQRGEHPIFFEENFGREPLFSYLVAISVYLLGASALSIRAVSAVAGIVTVLTLYFLVKEIFSQEEDSVSRYRGLLAAFILATSYWHVNFSREGLRSSLVPLFAVLTFYFLWRGVRRGEEVSFACSGFFLGASLYTYQAARFLPPFLILFLAYCLLLDKGFWRRYRRGLLLLLAVALITFAPLGYYFLSHPSGFTLRLGQASVATSGEGWDKAARTILTNTAKSLAMFSLRGDDDPRNNLPGRPALGTNVFLNVFLSVGFLLGSILALVRIRKPEYAFWVFWLGIMLLPTILSTYAPHYKRAIGVTPALAILTANGILALKEGVQRFTRRKTMLIQRGLYFIVLLAMGGGLVGSAMDTYHDYFMTWGKEAGLYYSFDVGLVSIAEYVNGLPPGNSVYLSPDHSDHPTIAFTLRQDAKLKSFDGRKCLVFPGAPGRDITYIVITYEDQRSLPLLRRYCPQGRVVKEGKDFDGWTYFVAYHVPGGSEWRIAPQHRLLANLDNKVKLLGYDFAAETYQPGDVVDLTLYWQALDEMDEDYTVFTHLLGSYNPLTNGPLWGGHDSGPGGGTYPTTVWEAGEIVVEEYGIPIQADAPPGEYQLEVGMYHLATMKRLPVLDDSGAVRDDRILLDTLQLVGE
jgi:4-amino-4-deoxy-L-arabinose transferase-like glycosyltransferase